MFRTRLFPAVVSLNAFRCATITAIPMPALSPTMEKGKISEWCMKPGDEVKSGSTFCKVETDKAVVSFDNATEEGYFARVIVEPGVETNIGDTVCIIVEDKADVDSDEVKNWKDENAAAPAAEEPAAPAAAAATPTPAAPAPAAAGDRVFASPYAKKIAKEKGISLQGVKGTGGGVGRITSKDVEAAIVNGGVSAAQPAAAAAAAAPQAAAAAAAAPKAAAKAPAKPAAGAARPQPPANANYTDIPVTSMRATIAKRLHQSKNIDIPHYNVFDECSADNMLALIKQLNAKGNGEWKITVNDYIIKAVARANLLVPEVNASWQGDFIRQYNTVDVSVAVATPTGLITPIIFNAHAKGLVEISKEMKELAKKARDGKLQPAEFQGGTCSVSNLGATGVPGFTAIINPPQAMILAIGSSKPQQKILHNVETGEYTLTGEVEQRIKFAASFDHRVVDGALGAKWFQGFHDAIENPLSLLL